MGVRIAIRTPENKVLKFYVDEGQVEKIDIGKKGKDLILPVGPDHFPLVMFHEGKYYFALPPDLFKGKIKKVNDEYSPGELVKKKVGKESQGLIWGIIDDKTFLELSVAGYLIKVSMGEIDFEEERKEESVKIQQRVEEKEKEKREVAPSGSMALAGGDSFVFFDFYSMKQRSASFYFVALSISVVIAIAIMIYIGTMKLPPMRNDIAAIPTRFAKLIVQNIPQPEEKKVEEKGEGGKRKKEVKQKMEETTKKGKAATGNVNPRARKAAMLKKVRHTGILVILTSKGGQGLVKDVVNTANSVGDLDKVLSQMGGVETAKAGMDIAAVKKTRIGGAVAAADIGSLGVGPGQQVSLGTKKVKRIRASINLGGGRISGAMGGEVIRRVVKMNIRGVKYCYEKELKRNPKLQGKIVVLFTIGMNGFVKKAKIQATTMHNYNVESCIVRMVLRWRFPRPEKGSVTVSYPFIFTPGS